MYEIIKWGAPLVTRGLAEGEGEPLPGVVENRQRISRHAWTCCRPQLSGPVLGPAPHAEATSTVCFRAIGVTCSWGGARAWAPRTNRSTAGAVVRSSHTSLRGLLGVRRMGCLHKTRRLVECLVARARRGVCRAVGTYPRGSPFTLLARPQDPTPNPPPDSLPRLHLRRHSPVASPAVTETGTAPRHIPAGRPG